MEQMLHIIDKYYGDKRLVWRGDDKESKNKAIEEFKERISRGWFAFKVDPDNPGKGKMIREFDEKAEKIIMTPAVQGG